MPRLHLLAMVEAKLCCLDWEEGVKENSEKCEKIGQFVTGIDYGLCS